MCANDVPTTHYCTYVLLAGPWLFQSFSIYWLGLHRLKEIVKFFNGWDDLCPFWSGIMSTQRKILLHGFPNLLRKVFAYYFFLWPQRTAFLLVDIKELSSTFSKPNCKRDWEKLIPCMFLRKKHLEVSGIRMSLPMPNNYSRHNKQKTSMTDEERMRRRRD